VAAGAQEMAGFAVDLPPRSGPAPASR